MRFLIIVCICICSGCSSPPPPTPFPTTEEININHIEPKRTSGTIKNSDNNNWIVFETIYIDSDNSIQSTTSDLINLNYLLDHADKITLEGEFNLIKQLKTFITFRHPDIEISLIPNCFVNYCSFLVNSTFKKGAIYEK